MNSPELPERLDQLFDETIEDGSLDRLPEGELRNEVMRQRFVHGLLRSMHSMDAEGREVRVQNILDALPAEGELGPAEGELGPAEGEVAIPKLRPWLVLAASVTILAGVAWFVFPTKRADLPRAEALVARAADQLAEPVNRHFTIVRTDTKANGSEWSKVSMELIARPGRFLIEGDSVFGAYSVGLDDEHIWYTPAIRTMWNDRKSIAIEDGELAMPKIKVGKDAPPWKQRRQRHRERGARRANKAFDELKPILDIGYVNLDQLLAKLSMLPETCTLKSTGREVLEIEGELRTLVRIEASGWAKEGKTYLDTATLWVDEVSGMITRAEVLVKKGRGQFVVEFAYHGTVPIEEGRYKRPW